MFETNLKNIEEAAVGELARLMPEKTARKSVGLIIRQAAREDGLSGCAPSRKGESALTIARLVRGWVASTLTARWCCGRNAALSSIGTSAKVRFSV